MQQSLILFAIVFLAGVIIAAALSYLAWRRPIAIRGTGGQARRELRLRQRERYLRLINEITQTAIGALDFDSMVQILADRLVELIDADGCHITLWDETRQLAKPAAATGIFREKFYKMSPLPGEKTMTQSVLEMGHALAIEDTTDTPYISERLAAEFSTTHSVLALPLIADGRELGAALLIFNQPHHFTPEEIQYSEYATQQIALALAKAQSLEVEREQRRLAESLHQVGLALNETLDVESVLDQLLDHIDQVVPFDTACIWQIQNDQAHVVRHRGYDQIAPELPAYIDALVFNVQETPNLLRLVETGQPYIVFDAAQDPAWIKSERTAYIRSWLGTPIVSQGKLLGIISVDKREANFYQPKHAQQLSVFAGQAALAWQNARFYQATRRQLDDLSLLHAIATIATETVDEDELIARATAVVVEKAYPDNFGVLLVDETTQSLIPHPSYYDSAGLVEPQPITIEEGIAGQVVKSGRPMRVGDVRDEPAFFAADPRTRSELCVPLRVYDRIIGVVNAESLEAHAFSTADEQLLTTLAGQLATAIERMRLFAAERQRRQEAETLAQITVALTSTLELDQVLNSMLMQLKQVLSYDSASVLLREGDNLRLVAGHGFPDSILDKVLGVTFPVKNTLVEKISREKRPIRLPDAQSDPRFKSWGDAHYIRGWIGAPLLVRDQVIGFLTVDNRQPDVYTEADAQLAQTFGNQAATAIENARLYAVEQRERRRAEVLRAANQALTETLDLLKMADTTLDFLHQLVPYDTACILFQEHDGRFKIKSWRGYEQWTNVDALDSITFDPEHNWSLQKISATRRSLLITNTQQHDNWECLPETEYINSWFGIPLIAGKQFVAILSVDHSQPNFFNVEHLQLGEALATQTAVAIQNAQLFQATRQSATELAIASRILRSLNATPLIYEALPEIGTTLKEITGCADAALFLLDKSRQWGEPILLEKPDSGPVLNHSRFALTETIAGDVIRNGRIHQTPDLATETDYKVERLLYEAGIRSRIILPLHIGPEVVGSLNLGWHQPQGYDPAHIPLLTQIANSISLAIERTRLFEETNRWAQQLTILNELGRQITGLLNVQALCQTVVRRLQEAFDYPDITVFTVNDHARTVTLEAIFSSGDPHIQPGTYQQKFGEGLVGIVAQTGRKLVINDTSQHPDFIPRQDVTVKSELALPLRAGGRTIGVLNVDSDRLNAFNENDVAIMAVVADQLAIALENARLFYETERRAAELEAITAVSADLRRAKSVNAILSIVLTHTAAVVEGDSGSIYLTDAKNGALTLHASYPDGATYHLPNEQILNHIIDTGQTYLTADPDADPGAESSASTANHISLPLYTQERTIGVLNLGLPAKRTISDAEIRLLTAIAEIAGSSLDRAQLLETLEQRVAARTQDLAAANERLQELDRLKSKFVSDVSHELRTPITNLSLYLDLLEKGKPERHKKYLTVLRKQANRLNNLIDDTLSLARLDLGQTEVMLRPVDLNEIVTQVTAAHLPRLEAAGLTLIQDLQSDLPAVLGEQNQLAQVITNLLTNAVNYTLAGQITVCTSTASGAQVCLEIEDTGCGIAASDLPHIFDRFYRGQETDQSNIRGTGLGLAIVKEIVDLHQGEIRVDSEVGHGAHFQIYLPQAAMN